MRPEVATAAAMAGANWTKLWNDEATRDEARALLVALWRKSGGTVPALAAATGLSQSTIKLWRRTDSQLRKLTPSRVGRPPKGAASDAANEGRKRAVGE